MDDLSGLEKEFINEYESYTVTPARDFAAEWCMLAVEFCNDCKQTECHCLDIEWFGLPVKETKVFWR